MPASITNRLTGTRYGSGSITVTLSATGTNRGLLLVCTGRTGSGSGAIAPVVAIGGQTGAVIGTWVAVSSGGATRTHTSLVWFSEGQYSAGSTVFTFTWGVADIAVNFLEMQGTAQSSPFINIETAPIDPEPANSVPLSITSTSDVGKLGIYFISSVSESAFTPSASSVSGNLGNLTTADRDYAYTLTWDDAEIASSSEEYTATLTGAGQSQYGFLAVNGLPQPSIASVDSDNSISQGQQDIVINVANIPTGNVPIRAGAHGTAGVGGTDFTGLVVTPGAAGAFTITCDVPIGIATALVDPVECYVEHAPE